MFANNGIFRVFTFLLLVASSIVATESVASPITYRPMNGAIFPDANPNGLTAMLNSVEKPAAKPKEATPLDQNRLIIQGLESRITGKIYDDIFNGTAPSGTYTLPAGGTISFIRTLSEIIITIVDSKGTVSTITVPNI